jgi:hypothetical protein
VAKKTRIAFIDDLTGVESEKVTSVEFALDGVTYEIDLDEVNAAELRDTLAVYVENGRRVGGRVQRGRRSGGQVGTSGDRKRAAEIRAWAQGQGYNLAERGRVPNNVVEAYEKAQGTASAA